MIETANMLTEAVSEAVETMAFLATMPLEEEPDIPEDLILGEISFTGPKNGVMHILAGSDFCEILAENIAALDEVDQAACLDALRELCNVTCGLILPQLAESSADVFDMSLPVIHTGAGVPDWRGFVGLEGARVLNIEEYPVAARVVIEN